LSNLKKIENLYSSGTNLSSNSYNYGSSTQHSKSSLNTTLPYLTTFLDQNSLNKFFSYSLNNGGDKNSAPNSLVGFNNIYDSPSSPQPNILNYATTTQSLGNKSISESYSHLNKIGSAYKPNSHTTALDEFIVDNNNTYFSWNLFNKEKSYKVKDLASPNLKFLSLEKSSRSFLNSDIGGKDSSLNFLNNLESTYSNFNFPSLSANLSSLYSNSSSH
jgi:hypothetical protein